eukprot:116198-Pelagomonas_calceolata.AAC.1
MKQGTPISLQDFTDDLRHRLCSAWRAAEGVDPRTTNNKLATYQAFFAQAYSAARHQLSIQAVSNFLLQCNKKFFYFMSELLDLLLVGMDQPQADQPNSLAEGLPV